MRFYRMAQWMGRSDLIVVAATLAMSNQDPGCLEIGNDHLHRPLGDADPLGNVTEASAGILRKADQYMGVVGQVGPCCLL